MDKRGESGIGTLIIFIAMLLVAAVAAGVLIQTTGSLQNKALVTGMQAENQISNHIDVISVTGTNGTSNSTIENVFMVVRLAAGSDTIDLNDVTTTIDTTDGSQTVTYNQFTLNYLQNGTGHKDGYLVFGDVAKLNATLTTMIGENAKIKITIIPKIGIPTTIDTITPDIMTDYNVHLYP
jgi:archaeal flagellin FlaB